MILRKKRFHLYSLLLLVFISFQVAAQDSTLYRWQVSSKKIDDKTYTVSFHTKGNADWQLYGANEVISEVPSTTLEFDSSIVVDKTFKDSGEAVQISK